MHHPQSDKPTQKLKGILKNTTAKPQPQQPQQTPVAISTESKNDEIHQIALRHAAIIQERQELDVHVHRLLVELSEYPPTRGPLLTAACPAPEDAVAFKTRVRVFPPADYDDLAAERNANGLCGYALCPLPPRKFARAGKFKIVNSAVDGFDIVRTTELRKWCSKDCQRRALWVKVQLEETPLVQRLGTPHFQVELLDEHNAANADNADNAATKKTARVEKDDMANEFSSLSILETKKQEEDAQLRNLAVERGEAGEAGDNTGRGLVNVVIREREASAPANSAPLGQPFESAQSDDHSHLMMEGYKTRLRSHISEDSITTK